MNSAIGYGDLLTLLEHSAFACAFIIIGIWWFFSVLAVQATKTHYVLSSAVSEEGSAPLRDVGSERCCQRDHPAQGFVSQLSYGRKEILGKAFSVDQLLIFVLSAADIVLRTASSRFAFTKNTVVHHLHATMAAFLALAAVCAANIVRVTRTSQYAIYSIVSAVIAFLWTAQSGWEGLGGASAVHAHLSLIYGLIGVATAVECVRSTSFTAAKVRAALFVLCGAWHGVCGATDYVGKDWWSDWSKPSVWAWTASAIFFAWTVLIVSLLLFAVSHFAVPGISQNPPARRQSRTPGPLTLAVPKTTPRTVAPRNCTYSMAKEQSGLDHSVVSPKACSAQGSSKRRRVSARRDGEETMPLLEILNSSQAKVASNVTEDEAVIYFDEKLDESTSSLVGESSLASCDLSVWLHESMDAERTKPKLSVTSLPAEYSEEN